MLLAESIKVTSDNLKLVMHMPHAVSGVVPFINQFTRLWIGTVNPDLFKKTFNELKAQVLPWLVDLALIQDNLNYRIGHKLELCHVALETKWDSPVTATIIDNTDIFWESGQSRFLAGGLCWAAPWQHHQLLAFAPDQFAVEPWIEDPAEITNDLTLSELLGADIDAVISTRLDVFDQKISFRLSSIAKKKSKKENTEKLESRVETVRQWVKLYPQGTKLDVYTNAPELIVDSIGYWDINYLDLTHPMTDANHTFYAPTLDQTLDLAELLFWMDTAYTNFVTVDGKCILRSPGVAGQTKTIGLSRL